MDLHVTEEDRRWCPLKHFYSCRVTIQYKMLVRKNLNGFGYCSHMSCTCMTKRFSNPHNVCSRSSQFIIRCELLTLAGMRTYTNRHTHMQIHKYMHTQRMHRLAVAYTHRQMHTCVQIPRKYTYTQRCMHTHVYKAHITQTATHTTHVCTHSRTLMPVACCYPSVDTLG